MDIDPIVLLAYISVAINVITMVAACAAYAMFHVRRRRRRQLARVLPVKAATRSPAAVFLQPLPLSLTLAPTAPNAPDGEVAPSPFASPAALASPVREKATAPVFDPVTADAVPA